MSNDASRKRGLPSSPIALPNQEANRQHPASRPPPFSSQKMPSEPPAGHCSPPYSASILQRLLSIFPADQRNNVGIRGDELFLGATKIGGYSDGRFLVDHKLAKPAVKLMPLFTALLEEKGTVVFYEITASSITVCAGKELGKKNIFYPLV